MGLQSLPSFLKLKVKDLSDSTQRTQTFVLLMFRRSFPRSMNMCMNTHLTGEALSGVSKLLTNMYILFLGSISTSFRPNTWTEQQMSAVLRQFHLQIETPIISDSTNLVKRPRRPL